MRWEALHLEPTPAACASLAAWTMSAALSDDLTDLTPSPPPSQMPLPTKKKEVESGSELSEPPSEDDRPHSNNKLTTKKPRTGRGIVPAPMWEWAKKKPTKPIDDDDDDDDEDNEDDDEGDVADADKTTNDDDVDEKLVDLDDDADDKADDTKAGPDADNHLPAVALDPPDADHKNDTKKTNGIAHNGILPNSFFGHALAHDRCSRTTGRQRRRQQRDHKQRGG